MRNHILIILLLTLIGCSKEYEGHDVKILGHAGMGINSFYPWNSYESLFKAMNLDSDGSEMDLQMTKDSVFVLFHSKLLEGETTAIGNISQLTWGQIKDARYNRPYLTNYSIAKLENIFAVLEGRDDKILDLEVKPYLGDEKDKYFKTFNSNLLQLIDKYNLSDNIIIEFNQEKQIKSFKAQNSTISVVVFNYYENGLKWAQQYDCDGVVVNLNNLDETKVSAIHNAGLKVVTFNVSNASDGKKALNLGVDVIQADNLQFMIDLVK